MLRVAGAFVDLRLEEAAKSPFGAAALFATVPGLLGKSSPQAESDGLQQIQRRKLFEQGTSVFGSNVGLPSIQGQDQVQEALLNYWADDGAALAYGGLIHRDIE